MACFAGLLGHALLGRCTCLCTETYPPWRKTRYTRLQALLDLDSPQFKFVELGTPTLIPTSTPVEVGRFGGPDCCRSFRKPKKVGTSL